MIIIDNIDSEHNVPNEHMTKSLIIYSITVCVIIIGLILFVVGINYLVNYVKNMI